MTNSRVILDNALKMALSIGIYTALFIGYRYISQLPGWVKSPLASGIAGAILIAVYGLELWYKSRPTGTPAPKLTTVTKFFPRFAAFCFFIAILESR